MLKVKKFVVNPFMENTYLLSDESGEATIIDCGCLYEKEQRELTAYVEENGLKVRHLINTHLHLDHQFGNSFATKAFGVEPKAHADDEKLIANMSQQSMLFGIPQAVEGQPLGGYIEHDETIRFGNTSLRAIHVPGHSKGSLCYYSEEAGVVFVGDVLFAGSIGRTDLPGGNYDQLISGIKERLLCLPEETVVYSGHGPETTIGEEKRNNPFLR